MLRHVFEKRNDKESERRVPKNGEEVQDSRNIIYRVNKYGTVCTMCVKQSFLQVDRGRSTRLQIADLAKSSKDGGRPIHVKLSFPGSTEGTGTKTSSRAKVGDVLRRSDSPFTCRIDRKHGGQQCITTENCEGG